MVEILEVWLHHSLVSCSKGLTSWSCGCGLRRCLLSEVLVLGGLKWPVMGWEAACAGTEAWLLRRLGGADPSCFPPSLFACGSDLQVWFLAMVCGLPGGGVGPLRHRSFPCVAVGVAHAKADGGPPPFPTPAEGVAGPQRGRAPPSHPKSLMKQGWQYGFSFCSLKVPLLSCLRQKAQTKCSGWNFRAMAVMQRPVMGFSQPEQSEPRCLW